ncbi:MAG: sigma-70 family RNA polymerase sigma factor [Gemmatimonadaceae bacterium]|nr:sigma-70 family RNA polymerase sigma factor [Chitinophagaceae bacterium]
MYTEKEFLAGLDMHQGILHKVTNLYMKDPAEREDLFQEILLNAWKGVKTFKGESKFSTWLYRVALNTAIGYYRKKNRTVDLVTGGDEIESHTEDEDGEENTQAMYQAIAELSSIDKALVMLYLEDYSYIEIGEILGITANNVAVKMNRIKLRLKDLAKKYM